MYVSPTTAMVHQVEALRRVSSRPASPCPSDVFAHLMETGTGKTFVVLSEFQSRVADPGRSIEGDIDNLVVLAPAGSYKNWYVDKADEPCELKKHLDPRLIPRLAVAAWEDGAAARRQRDDVLGVAGRPRAMFMNVEALSSGTRATDYAVAFMRTGRTMLAVDESTSIRNDSTRRTKVIVGKLAPLAAARRIVTGLVSPRSPLDLYWQFYFLDWRILGFSEFTTFRARYAEVEKVSFLPRPRIEAAVRPRFRRICQVCRGQPTCDEAACPVGLMSRADLIEAAETCRAWIQATTRVKSFKNLTEIQKKIAPYSYRVLKSECLDLPSRTYESRDVELTPEQRRMYDEIKKQATTLIESSGTHVTAGAVVQQMLRLHQVVCGHAVDEEGVAHDVASNRIQLLVDLLRDHDRKAVVWVTYRRELSKIAASLREEFGPGSVAEFHGGNKATRSDDESRFIGNPECRWMLASPGAGARGNNWQVADLNVYAANNFDLELRLQSEDRVYRKGQDLPVTNIDLIARGTVEEKIIWALRNKLDLAAAVTGDAWRRWLV